MIPNYKHAFSHISFINRWKQSKHKREVEWTIVGISTRHAGNFKYSYKISFFGFDLKMFLNKHQK